MFEFQIIYLALKMILCQNLVKLTLVLFDTFYTSFKPNDLNKPYIGDDRSVNLLDKFDIIKGLSISLNRS